MLRVLPQLFYQSPETTKVLVDGLSCIVHKKLNGPVWQKEGYVSTHAITMVLNGRLKVENDNGAFTHVEANEMVFLPKGIYMISDIIPDGNYFEAVVFFFDEDVINDFIGTLNLKSTKDKCIPHLKLEYTEPIRLFTESLLQLYGKDDKHAHRHLTKVKLMEFLHLIRFTQPNSCFVNALMTLNNKERKSLRVFMEDNFSKPLAIADYAYLTGRSLSTFRRDFIAQFGVSPKQWLIEKRLERAHDLLSRNHTSVSEVALEAGYENISHFIKAFHRRFGIPPKQFLMQRRKEVFV